MPGLTQIRASAGSGKTWTLTLNYLQLLAGAAYRESGSACALPKVPLTVAPADILAITFTNAAATEMRERVLLRLKNIALGRPNPDVPLSQASAQAWVTSLLRDLNAINIRTIDSLLHMITRVSALQLCLAPDFEEKSAVEDVLAPYLETFIEQAATDEGLRAILRKTCEAMISSEEGRGFVASARMYEYLRRTLDDCLLGNFENLASEEEIKKKDQELKFRAFNLASQFYEAGQKSGNKWNAKVLAMLAPFLENKLPDRISRYLERQHARELFTGSPAISVELENLWRQFSQAALASLNNLGLLKQATRYTPFCGLGNLLAKAFLANCQVEGVVPLLLIPQLAARALADEAGISDAMCRIGNRLTHFLVDEFQDTSREQWQALRALVLEALSRGGSLTWVGDVKQSIYGWRGADPGLFSEAGHDRQLCAIAGPPASQSLEKNRRSAKNIVYFNNAIFSALADKEIGSNVIESLLPRDTPCEIIGEICKRLSENFSDATQETDSEKDGYVYAEQITGANQDELNEAIIERLRQHVGQITQRRRPEDVLVLVRSNEQATLAAQALIEDGHNVMTENSLLLSAHPLIIQSLSFLAFLENPENDIAFAALISGDIFRSAVPASALTFQQIADCMATHGNLPLYRHFRDTFPECWDALLSPFFNQSGLMTAYDLIMEWYEFMNVEKNFPDSKLFLRRFMEILHRAECRDCGSLTSFLEYWQKEGSEEKTPLPSHMDAIRVMTVHKAKGLAAPVVVVPWTNYSVKPGKKLIAREFDGLRLPVMQNTKAAGRKYYEEYGRQALEALNTLYVAFTRPKEELHFFLNIPEGRSASGLFKILPDLLSHAGYELPLTLGKPENVVPNKGCAEAETQADQNDCSLSMPSPDGLPESWKPMQWLPDLKIFRKHADPSELKAENRGAFLHFCLERLEFASSPAREAEKTFEYGLLRSGIPMPEDESIRTGLLAALEWFASLPWAKDWLEKGDREQSLLDEHGNLLRPDLITPWQAGFLVIDYKSGSPSAAYARQVRRYLAALEKITPQSGPYTGLLVYLDQKKFQLVGPQTASTLLDSPFAQDD